MDFASLLTLIIGFYLGLFFSDKSILTLEVAVTPFVFFYQKLQKLFDSDKKEDKVNLDEESRNNSVSHDDEEIEYNQQ